MALKRSRKKDKVREAAYGRHSPAGFRHLQEEKRKTMPTYYRLKGLRRKTPATRLREAGLSESDLRSLGYKKRKR